MGGQGSTTWWLCVGVLSAGCNILAGIDQDFVMADGSRADSGLDGAGGVSGEGGEAGTRGASGDGGTEGAGATLGSGGSDGASGTGGTGEPDAAGGSGGSGGTPCGPNQKRCGDSCVEPGANFGCSLSDCDPCPDAAPNTEIICGDQQCVAKCKQGYVPIGGQCVLENSVDAAGGSGGSSGAGGNGGSGGNRQCTVEQCPSCSLARGMACCTFFRTCGCSFVNVFYCI